MLVPEAKTGRPKKGEKSPTELGISGETVRMARFVRRYEPALAQSVLNGAVYDWKHGRYILVADRRGDMKAILAAALFAPLLVGCQTQESAKLKQLLGSKTRAWTKALRWHLPLTSLPFVNIF
jgi:hypothetical protein